MTGFKRKTPANEGDFRFNGTFLQSAGIYARLQPAEVFYMLQELHEAVKTYDGLNDFQVFEAPDGRVVWAIDERRQWTLLLPEEY